MSDENGIVESGTRSLSQGATQVQTADTTLVEKYTTASVGDLKVGEGTMVSASQNDDGSVTARSY
jgi:hypothetical protein